MEQPLISILMPCLNMEKYIEQSIESAINQTVKEIEILIIDAGSTDSTLEILEKYAKKDNRIKIIHSLQKSYGHQMNIGISEAKGKYIGVLDPDDLLVENAYEELYYVALKSNADYVKGTAEGFFDLGNCENYHFPITSYPIHEYGDRIEVVPKDTPAIIFYDTFLWYGLYQADFFKQIYFLETPGAAFQDIAAMLQIHMSAKKAVYISKCVYYYRQDNNKASSYNHKGFLYIAEEYEYAEKFLEGKSVEWRSVFYHKMFMHWKNRFWIMAFGEFWDDAVLDMERVSDRICEADKKGIILYKEMPEEYFAEIELFQQNPYLLYQIYRKEYEKCQNVLKKLLVLVKEENIVIFGTGKYGDFLYKTMLYNQITGVMAYCDNNKERQGKKLGKLPVLSPEEAVSVYKEAYFIITSKKHREDMKEQLEWLGVEKGKILFFHTGEDRRIFTEKLL